MKQFIILFTSILLSLSFFIKGISAKPTVAFGYMHNMTNDRELSSLEFIFPNSFANSINAIFDVNVKKPLQLEKELGKNSMSLKKNYEYYELPDLIREIKSDIFIFGNFVPLANNQIKILLNIYIKGHNEIFTFTNTGRMETQVAKLVDRISIIIINFMSEHNLFKIRKIMPGTRLSVLTNLEGEEQNSLLTAFMEKGYKVLCFQNDDIRNIVDNFTIKKFSYIRTSKNSFDIITDWRKSEFYHSTWTGEKYLDSVDYIKYLYKKYDLSYELIKDETLEKLCSAFDNGIDVLLIIGFSDNRRSSWVRAIDMKEKELIWIQSNIKSDILSLDPVMSNVNKIVDWMTAEPLNPFRKADETAQGK